MNNPRILVPPGIGDIYWVLVKLPALMHMYGWKKPELTILSTPDKRGGHLRAIPYLEMFDWFSIGDPKSIPNSPELQSVYDEAYLGPRGRSIFEKVHGYDYFISYNGRVNSGGYIENDNVPCDWQPKMATGPELLIEMQHRILRPVDYAVMFWPFYGSYQSHLADFPIENIAEALSAFLRERRLVPVFVGSKWDDELNPKVRQLMAAIPNSHDMIGKTSLVQLFGLLKAAKIVLGYHAGITQMAAVFGTPTFLLWDNRWPASTSYAVVPPDVRGTSYVASDTKGLTADAYYKSLCEFYEKRN